MTKIIFLNGPPRSGKDTLGRMIKNYFHYGAVKPQAFKPIKNGDLLAETFKLANILKLKTHKFFIDIPGHESHHNPDFFESIKDKPSSFFVGLTPRQAYIWMSEDVIKPKFGKDYFGKIVAKNVEIMQQHITPKLEYVVITDSGFIDECRPFRDLVSPEQGMLVVHVSKRGAHFTGDSRSYIELTNVPIIKIENPDGAPEIAATAILDDMKKRWGSNENKE